jgi:myo-inositol-1(or 4)-monophosphatase
MEEFLEPAVEAARAAGSLILENWSRHKEIRYKSAIDLVTPVDHASEERIVTMLHDRFPAHSILAEEKTSLGGSESNYRWIIDPLDGTTNFAHTYPHFSVSIALEHDGEMIVGVVHDPLRRETFHAVKDGGAFLNGAPIQVSRTAALEQALLATGFPYDRREKPDYYLAFFKRFMVSTQGIRRNGSAALDLCYVACGRVDGFWELKLHAWDTAAGSLVVREAGGTITDFSGENFSVWQDQTLASNGSIHAEMLRAVQEAAALTHP